MKSSINTHCICECLIYKCGFGTGHRLEQEPPTSVLVMAVESNAMTIIGSNCSGKWDRKLDATLLEDMGKYRFVRCYNPMSCMYVSSD